ncbi:MAG: hypothetical protein C0392_01260 [Syntrophus sp. (in: bacteria)]|nr:hypothetical protein [Syntrophus sp. (in: bacteria)]
MGLTSHMNNESHLIKELVEELASKNEIIASLKKSAEELKRVERALRESEKRYRSLIRQSSDGVYIFHHETGRILEANDQFLRMLGYTEEEITSLRLYDIVTLDKNIVDANIQKVLQDRQYLFGLRQYVCKDGSLIDVEISSTLIRYGSSKVIMVNVRNMSERMRDEKELQIQTDKMRDQAELLDIAEDAIIVGTLDGTIIFWNHGAVERYGWSKKDAMGKQVQILLNSQFPESIDKIREDLFREGRWEGEVIHQKSDGTKIIVDSKWALRKNKDGKPAAIMEINNDITKRKRAEEALQKTKDELELRVEERTIELKEMNERLINELNRRKQIEDLLRKGAERYKNLFEDSPIGIYRTNPDGRILMANPILVRMLGFSSFNQLASTPLKNGDYEPSYLKKKMKKRLEREGRVRGFEAKWKRFDGSTIYVRENAQAVRAPDGTVIYYEGTVEDISEQKKAEEKINSYQNQLRSLASDLSLAEERERRRIATTLHDHIGQILAISKIKLGALLECAKESDIEESLREVRSLVGQAIQYTRSLTSELSPPILYELGLEAALEWLCEQAHEQHGIAYEFETDQHMKPVSDEIRIFLFTAVRELLVNVAKHANAQKVKVTARRIDRNISIHVADDGIGFNTSKVTFYLDKNKGFGLFSIRERLTHLGGQMEIKSQRGRSARIILSAPLKTEK